jgi:uncharacterized protein YlxW (UPF0749 family)
LNSVPRDRRSRLITVILVTFLMATAVTAQVKAQLIPTSNRVARGQALVRSVQGLEQDNQNLRRQVQDAGLRIAALTRQLAQRSGQARSLADAANAQRDLAGVTPVNGPGIAVDLVSGRDPHTSTELKPAWRVSYIDIQDLVNLLWSSGAEAVSVNRQRVVPTSSFYEAGTDVLLNGVRLSSPYRVEAIGDTSRFNQALGDPANLDELKSRSQLYQLKLSWSSQRQLKLPGYVGALVVRYAVVGQ